jgi:glycosyltransferase involved in cell wall biosynthesis
MVALRAFLQRRGIECPVVNLSRYGRGDGTDTHHPRSAAGLASLLFRLRCDVLHFHVGGNLSLRLLGLLLYAAFLPRRRTVLTFHSGGYPRSAPGSSAKPGTLRGMVLRRLDRVIAVNEELVALFHRLGLLPSRVRLIPPFVLPGPHTTGALPSDLAAFIRSHRPVLVTVGGLEPEYDLVTQIRALETLLTRQPRAGLLVIGSGSLEGTLRGMVAARPIASDVLLCGDLSHADTLRVIADADVFLRTTLYDGDSISVREALHLGTPVIATDAAPRPPDVALVAARDPVGLSRAIEEVAQAPAGSRPRPVLDESNLVSVLELYEDLCARRSAS